MFSGTLMVWHLCGVEKMARQRKDYPVQWAQFVFISVLLWMMLLAGTGTAHSQQEEHRRALSGSIYGYCIEPADTPLVQYEDEARPVKNMAEAIRRLPEKLLRNLPVALLCVWNLHTLFWLFLRKKAFIAYYLTNAYYPARFLRELFSQKEKDGKKKYKTPNRKIFAAA